MFLPADGTVFRPGDPVISRCVSMNGVLCATRENTSVLNARTVNSQRLPIRISTGILRGRTVIAAMFLEFMLFKKMTAVIFSAWILMSGIFAWSWSLGSTQLTLPMSEDRGFLVRQPLRRLQRIGVLHDFPKREFPCVPRYSLAKSVISRKLAVVRPQLLV